MIFDIIFSARYNKDSRCKRGGAQFFAKEVAVHMLGLIDVGGGLRGAYTAGVYDYLLEQGVHFDYCVGVSAGAANLVSYLSGQKERNLRFYTIYAMRPEYMSVGNLLRNGSYLDVNYIYSTLPNANGEDPVDYDAFAADPTVYEVVATHAQTGRPHYFTKADVHRDDFSILKASSCLPIACRAYSIGGTPYFDGGIADPVPYQRALAAGCDRIVLLLTRPVNFRRPPQQSNPLLWLALRRYPAVLQALRERHLRYNQAVVAVRELETAGSALIAAPTDISGMHTLTRNKAAIERLYAAGWQDGAKVAAFARQA